jgi:hypothetical protein
VSPDGCVWVSNFLSNTVTKIVYQHMYRPWSRGRYGLISTVARAC